MRSDVTMSLATATAARVNCAANDVMRATRSPGSTTANIALNSADQSRPPPIDVSRERDVDGDDGAFDEDKVAVVVVGGVCDGVVGVGVVTFVVAVVVVVVVVALVAVVVVVDVAVVAVVAVVVVVVVVDCCVRACCRVKCSVAPSRLRSRVSSSSVDVDVVEVVGVVVAAVVAAVVFVVVSAVALVATIDVELVDDEALPVTGGVDSVSFNDRPLSSK